MTLFLDNTMNNMTKVQKQAYDSLLKAEIERVQYIPSEAEYLKVLTHISSFYRPLYPVAMSDKDLLIHYYLKPKQALFFSGRGNLATPSSQAELKECIKLRTFKNLPNERYTNYDDEMIKQFIFGTLFLVAAIVAAVTINPPVAIIAALAGVLGLTMGGVNAIKVSRDTSAYLDKVEPIEPSLPAEPIGGHSFI